MPTVDEYAQMVGAARQGVPATPPVGQQQQTLPGPEIYSPYARGNRELSHGLMGDMLKAVGSGMLEDIKSIPHLIPAVMHPGFDKSASEEENKARRRAVGLAGFMLADAGLGFLSAGVLSGAPLALKWLGSMATMGAASGVQEELQTAPGQKADIGGAMLGGAAQAAVLFPLGHFVGSRLFRKAGGELLKGGEAEAERLAKGAGGPAVPPPLGDLEAAGQRLAQQWPEYETWRDRQAPKPEFKMTPVEEARYYREFGPEATGEKLPPLESQRPTMMEPGGELERLQHQEWANLHPDVIDRAQRIITEDQFNNFLGINTPAGRDLNDKMAEPIPSKVDANPKSGGPEKTALLKRWFQVLQTQKMHRDQVGQATEYDFTSKSVGRKIGSQSDLTEPELKKLIEKYTLEGRPVVYEPVKTPIGGQLLRMAFPRGGGGVEFPDAAHHELYLMGAGRSKITDINVLDQIGAALGARVDELPAMGQLYKEVIDDFRRKNVGKWAEASTLSEALHYYPQLLDMNREQFLKSLTEPKPGKVERVSRGDVNQRVNARRQGGPNGAAPTPAPSAPPTPPSGGGGAPAPGLPQVEMPAPVGAAPRVKAKPTPAEALEIANANWKKMREKNPGPALTTKRFEKNAKGEVTREWTEEIPIDLKNIPKGTASWFEKAENLLSRNPNDAKLKAELMSEAEKHGIAEMFKPADVQTKATIQEMKPQAIKVFRPREGGGYMISEAVRGGRTLSTGKGQKLASAQTHWDFDRREKIPVLVRAIVFPSKGIRNSDFIKAFGSDEQKKQLDAIFTKIRGQVVPVNEAKRQIADLASAAAQKPLRGVIDGQVQRGLWDLYHSGNRYIAVNLDDKYAMEAMSRAADLKLVRRLEGKSNRYEILEKASHMAKPEAPKVSPVGRNPTRKFASSELRKAQPGATGFSSSGLADQPSGNVERHEPTTPKEWAQWLRDTWIQARTRGQFAKGVKEDLSRKLGREPTAQEIDAAIEKQANEYNEVFQEIAKNPENARRKLAEYSAAAGGWMPPMPEQKGARLQRPPESLAPPEPAARLVAPPKEGGKPRSRFVDTEGKEVLPSPIRELDPKAIALLFEADKSGQPTTRAISAQAALAEKVREVTGSMPTQNVLMEWVAEQTKRAGAGPKVRVVGLSEVGGVNPKLVGGTGNPGIAPEEPPFIQKFFARTQSVYRNAQGEIVSGHRARQSDAEWLQANPGERGWYDPKSGRVIFAKDLEDLHTAKYKGSIVKLWNEKSRLVQRWAEGGTPPPPPVKPAKPVSQGRGLKGKILSMKPEERMARLQEQLKKATASGNKMKIHQAKNAILKLQSEMEKI